MHKVAIVKAIVKLYFLGALAVSFSHIIEASHKLGLTGWQAYTTPFAIDGIAIIGMVMRCASFSADTRRLGLRVQIGAGALSLAANVFAGSTPGERIYGVMIVALFLLSEWLGDRLAPASVDVVRERAARRSAAAKAAAVTRAANKAKAPAKRARRPRTQLAPATA